MFTHAASNLQQSAEGNASSEVSLKKLSLSFCLTLSLIFLFLEKISAVSSLSGSQRSLKLPSSLNFKGESSSSQRSSLTGLVADHIREDREQSTSQADLLDDWSMPLFSELLPSSHWAKWSFDSGESKDFPQSNSQLCGVCSKSMKERSPLTSHNMASNNGLTVAAVLVCGHVFHAECLENETQESEKFDPSCPVCSERPAMKKTKISRRAVVDLDLERVKVRGQKGAVEKNKITSFGSISRLKKYFSMDSKSMLPTESKRNSFLGKNSSIQVKSAAQSNFQIGV